MKKQDKKQNCWEFKQCGKGLGQKQSDNCKQCPAAVEQRLDGVHDGTNAGRACWVISGTFCGGKKQGTFAAKQIACKKCHFYQLVEVEEGDDFQMSLTLLSRLKKPSK